MAISLDDVQFLDLIREHGEAGAALAQGYLDNSNPAERQARIADLARTLIDNGQQQADLARTWLEQAGITPPAQKPDGGDACPCGGTGGDCSCDGP